VSVHGSKKKCHKTDEFVSKFAQVANIKIRQVPFCENLSSKQQ